MHSKTISSGNCFLFLLNIIVGTGVFLNTTQLYYLLKEYSYLAYIVTGILMIPIVCVTYLLAHDNEGVNLTVLFTKYFGSLNAFFVPLYALSKFSTTVIGMLFISGLLKNMIVGVGASYFFTLLFFFLIYLLCLLLVYYEVSINYVIQKMIIFIKLIPLLGIILFFIFYIFYNPLFSYELFNSTSDICNSFSVMQGASITIFAFSGFESLFAINHMLGGNKKKGALLLGGSFLGALLLYMLYQFCIGNLASYFLIDNSRMIPFAVFLEQCFSNIAFSWVFILLINFAIMVSSLGVAHGIMYATVNNIYASLMHLFSKRLYAKYFVFALVPFYALLGMNNIFILQQLSSLGTIVTYGLFVFCYLKMKNKNNGLFILSVLSILILFGVHFYNALYYFGFIGYAIYIFFVLLLLVLYFFTKIERLNL